MKHQYSANPLRAHVDMMQLPTGLFGPRTYLITRIEVAKDVGRGTGVARELMRRVLADADAENVTLWRSVLPDGTGLDNDQLRQWYSRLGFVNDTTLGDELAMMRQPEEIVYLATLQFHYGGLFDTKPADSKAHLVRATKCGTPGATLCGIDRFATETPGWSIGGGVSGPGITHAPCEGCVTEARKSYPGLPIVGLGAKEVATQLDVQHHHHSADVLR